MSSLNWTFVAALSVQSPNALGQEVREAALASIYREYVATVGHRDVDTLVRLDRQLRSLLPGWSWEGRPLRIAGDTRRYATMGVEPLAFEQEFVGYSGKLLRDAHAINPRSHRQFTLYGAVFGADGEMGHLPPRPDRAMAYLLEFPSGPFALHAHLALGHFNSDLYQVIQREESGAKVDDKYECYRASVTNAPLAAQRQQAQSSAIQHYNALVRLRPEVSAFADWLTNARQGRIKGWHYCSD